MKNGFIKKNDKRVYPFNSSKNIEHKGFKLYDYIETLKKNIIRRPNYETYNSFFTCFYNDNQYCFSCKCNKLYTER